MAKGKEKHIQYSFSRGILSPNLITRLNLKQYNDVARDIYNLLIGRQGEVYRRSGTFKALATDKTPARIIPFTQGRDAYLILMYSGEIINRNDVPNIQVVNITNTGPQILDSNFSSSDFPDLENLIAYDDISSFEEMEGYYIKDNERLSENELKSLDFTQLGNTIVFTSPKFAPFFIRKEGDDFYFYRGVLDLVMNGDDGDKISDKALFGLPFSYYGLGLSFDSIEKTSEGIRFVGYLTLKDNFDSSGLNRASRDFWKNRAFVLSSVTDDTPQEGPSNISKIYGGIIYDMQVTSGSGRPSKFRISGLILTDDEEDEVNSLRDTLSNLFICDWSPNLGFPRSVCIFENRIIYGGHNAYPDKIWFSAQPGAQRIQVATRENIVEKTDTSIGFNYNEPIYRTIHYDQLDLFDREVELLGSVPLNHASPGSYFVQDRLGFFIQWVRANEALFIGTDIGVFTSLGTNAQGAQYPLNSGFKKSMSHPIKEVLPEVIHESLYFVSLDNSIKRMRYQEARRDFVIESMDTFSRETINDPTVKEEVTRTITERTFAAITTNVGGEGNTDDCLIQAKRSEALNLVPNARVQTYYLNTIGGDERHYYNQFALFSAIKDKQTSRFTTLDTYRAIIGTTNLNITPEDDPNDDDEGLTEAQLNAAADALWTNKKDLSGIQESLSLNVDYQFLGALLNIDAYGRRQGENDHRIEGELNFYFLTRKGTPVPDYTLRNINRRVVTRGMIEMETNMTVSPHITTQKDEDDIFDLSPVAITSISSWIKGEISSGHISCSRDFGGTRLCGIDRRSARSMRLYFDKQNLPVTKVVISSGAGKSGTKYYEGDLGVTRLVANSDEFGRESKNVYYVDIALTADAPTTEEFFIQFQNVLSGETSPTDFGLDISVKMEQDGNTYQMRDSLLNSYSGEYDVRSGFYQIYELDNDPDDQVDDVEIRSQSDLNNFYTTYIQPRLSDLDIQAGRNRDLPAGGNNPNPTTPTGPITTIEETAVSNVISKYPIFNANARMIYDWTIQTLFIFRKGRPYLALTMDDQAGVQGWSRGDMGLEEAVFIGKGDYMPPDYKPTLYGIVPNGVAGLGYGLLSGKEQYIKNLPNGLDEHIILDVKNLNKLDTDKLKDTLKDELGYDDDDTIQIASSDRVVKVMEMKNLSGNIDIKRYDDLIIGKQFFHELITYPPNYRNREGYALGKAYSAKSVIFNALKMTTFMYNSGKNTVEQRYKDAISQQGSALVRGSGISDKEFDPIVKINSTSPFPFSVGGYIMELDIGG